MLVASTEQLANSDRLKQGINQILSIIETYHQPWMNGLVLLEDREQNKHCLSTGCESFDMLLQGGLHEGHVTELVGPSSSGKTQVCFQFASNVAMKLGGVVFLDSGNSFSPTRMQQIVTHISGSAENKINGILQQAMRNIECHAVFDVYALLNVLHQQKLKLKSQTGYQVRLIIVDSISSLIAPILGGSNAHGHALMVSVGYLLKELADRHNIAVVVTNHMVGGEGGTLKPALGESWKNIPHVRLQLSQDHARNVYAVQILRHPYMASGRNANFMIP
ncbi:DNA repair protein RAD51 homolog 4 isoform X2 [Cynara cardunculus var. scolymus]|nr:DNA repair protein RAD51 homolog 4 isoform X2 [Cynara cardunculus var. scolymus]XP_024975132.1 DNA repair protein RAD51 homolog 4 isoform X2 [Cynara cardunculus var. scolymus]